MEEEMMQIPTLDPISGNEVPPGAEPEEVRDDVEAKLSEGEYVVPADVVRYFGVGYFERLREKAKKALSKMDQEGRIGGSESDEDDDDDFPFDEEELEFEDDEAPVEMAAGGIVGPSWKPKGNMPNGANFNASAFPTFERKEFVGPDGKTVSVLYLNGSPITLPPAGYTEKGAAEEVPKEVAVDRLQGSGGGRENEPDTTTKFDKPTSEWTNEDISKVAAGIDQHAMVGKGLSAMMGPLGGLTSKAMEKSINNRVEDMLSEIERRVEAGTMSVEEANKARQSLKSSKVEQIMGASLSPVKNLANLTKKAFDSSKERDLDALARQVEKKEGAREGSMVAMGQGRENDGDFGAQYERAAEHARENPTGQTTGRGLDVSDVAGSMPGGFAKGGLVARPKKSKKKC